MPFRDYKNVTIALQFNQKRKALTAAEKAAIEKLELEKAAQLAKEENGEGNDNDGDSPTELKEQVEAEAAELE